jgi:hypothetical protein
MFLLYEPALEKRDTARIALFRVRSDGDLGEADRFAIVVEGEQDLSGIATIASEECGDLPGVLAGIGRPQRLAHALPGDGVHGLGGSNLQRLLPLPVLGMTVRDASIA